MNFLDPKIDVAFKRIFGDEKRKDILINFLNNILHLHGDSTITDIVLLNPHQAPHIKDAKETIVDVRCCDQSGAEYIVEMQVLPAKFFDQRVLYYISQSYSSQMKKGYDYDRLRPIIFLGILDFQFSGNSHYVSTHLITDVDTGETLLNDFKFVFVELPKFCKIEAELETVEDKWIYFLKNASKLEAIPEVIKERAIKEAFEVVNQFNWTEAELDYYVRRSLRIYDQIHQIEYGFDKGLEKGRKQGIEQGAHNNSKKMALKLLAKNYQLEEIAELTELSIDEIKAIKINQ